MKIEESVLQNWKEKIIDTETLINMYGENVLTSTFKGDSLLHVALKANDKFLINDLLKRKNLSLHIPDLNGLTPLRLAIIKKRAKFLKLIINHPNFDIEKERKSNIDDFFFEQEKSNRNYRTKSISTRTEEFYRMFDENNNSYKPSILSLLMLNKMEGSYNIFSKILKDEEFSSDLSLSFDNPGFEDLAYRTPIPVTIFEIALYSGCHDIAMNIFNQDVKFVVNLIKNKVNARKSLLFFTSKGEYGFDNKVVLKHYPLQNLFKMFIDSSFLKKEENIKLKNNFINLSYEIEGNFFEVDNDFIENLMSLIEQFLILKNSTSEEKIPEIKKRRI